MDKRKLRIIGHGDAALAQILVWQEVKLLPVLLDHADKTGISMRQDPDDLAFGLMASPLQYASQDHILIHGEMKVLLGYIIAHLIQVDEAESLGIHTQGSLKITKAFSPLIAIAVITRQQHLVLQRIQFPHQPAMLRTALHIQLFTDLMCAEVMLWVIIHQLEYTLSHSDPLLS